MERLRIELMFAAVSGIFEEVLFALVNGIVMAIYSINFFGSWLSIVFAILVWMFGGIVFGFLYEWFSGKNRKMGKYIILALFLLTNAALVYLRYRTI